MNRSFSLLFLALICTACQKSPAPTQSTEVANVGLHAAALSDDGEHSVVGSIYHGGSFWRLSDNERLYNWNHTSDEPSTIIASDFSDDGSWALTSDPHTMVLWNIGTGQGARYWTAPAEVLDVELNRAGTLALLGLDDNTAVIFDVQRGGVRRTFAHQNRVRSVDFNKNSTLAITGSEDYTAAIWDTQSGKMLTKIKHNDDVQLVKLSDDGKIALSVSKYDKAILWDPRTAEQIAEIPLKAEHLRRGLRFTAARFSHDNQYLLTGRPDRIVQLWELSLDDKDKLKEIQRWTLPKRNAWKPTNSAVLDVAFNDQNSTFYAVGSNGFVHTLKQPQ